MRIILLFQFNHAGSPSASTGIAGNVHDMLLPCVGDTVVHRDEAGRPFRGKVTDRTFAYEIPAGVDVDGTVT